MARSLGVGPAEFRERLRQRARGHGHGRVRKRRGRREPHGVAVPIGDVVWCNVTRRLLRRERRIRRPSASRRSSLLAGNPEPTVASSSITKRGSIFGPSGEALGADRASAPATKRQPQARITEKGRSRRAIPTGARGRCANSGNHARCCARSRSKASPKRRRPLTTRVAQTRRPLLSAAMVPCPWATPAALDFQKMDFRFEEFDGKVFEMEKLSWKLWEEGVMWWGRAGMRGVALCM